MTTRNLRTRFSKYQRYIAALFMLVSSVSFTVYAQTNQQTVNSQTTFDKYLDLVNGKTVDDLVSFALANNAELIAIRKESDAGEALIKQARLRANPSAERSAFRTSARSCSRTSTWITPGVRGRCCGSARRHSCSFMNAARRT